MTDDVGGPIAPAGSDRSRSWRWPDGWLRRAPAHPAAAQIVANQVINGFEIAPAGSLEWEILDRLAASHRYDPRDLPRLARMTVLESIAMYENVRADLPATMIGARSEGEMSHPLGRGRALLR